MIGVYTLLIHNLPKNNTVDLTSQPFLAFPKKQIECNQRFVLLHSVFIPHKNRILHHFRKLNK